MNRRKTLAAAALAASYLLIGTSAIAGPCVSAPVATYTAGGFSCTVDGLSFSNIAVNTTVSNSGSVTLGNFTPVNPLPGEFGLLLNYTALAPAANATADVSWFYNVAASGASIDDAYLALAGNITGSGQAQVNEILSNGVSISLNAPGSTTAIFAPVDSLFVMKDQSDFVGADGGTSTTSALTNAFSTTAVPEPATLALLGTALVGFGAIRRRRKSV